MSDSDKEEVQTKKTSKGQKRKKEPKEKKSKKEKNKGPKRALSAYMFFVKDNRQKVLDKYPDLSFGEVGKKLGKMWGDMSDDEKAPYARSNKADKERYDREKANYDETAGDDAPKDKKKKKSAPKPKKAKKPKKEESEDDGDDDGDKDESGGDKDDGDDGDDGNDNSGDDDDN